MDANPYASPKSGDSHAQPRRRLRAGHIALFGASLFVGTWGFVWATWLYMWHAADIGPPDATDFENSYKAFIQIVSVAVYVQWAGACLAIGGFSQSKTFQKACARLRRDPPTPQQ